MTDKTPPQPPKRGQEFTHSSFRRQLPDGTQPFAVMKVTAVRRGNVFYTYADSPTNKGDWYMPLENWVKRYRADPVESTSTARRAPRCQK